MLDRRAVLHALAVGSAILPTASRAESTSVEAGPTFGERMNAFGPEAEQLAKRTGVWDVVETVWASPTASPVVNDSLVAERLMYGSLLQEILRTAPVGDGASVARTDMLAYNRLEGRWDYVSFDTRAPVGLMPAWSNDGGGTDTITLGFAPFAVPASTPEPAGLLLRMDQIIRFTDAGHDVKDQYFTLADGSGSRWLAHRYAYTRRD